MELQTYSDVTLFCVFYAAPNADVGVRPVNPANPDFNPSSTIEAATHKGSFVVALPVTSDLAPQGNLVVYYVRPDGEVVSDMIQLNLPECSENKVGNISCKNFIVS